MGKTGNTFQLYYGSGNAQGSGATMTVASSWDSSGNLTCSNNVNIGHGIINTGMQKMMIYGTDNSVNGPHIQTFTSVDNYPLLQIMSLQQNNIMLGFDTYFNGTTYRLVIQEVILY